MIDCACAKTNVALHRPRPIISATVCLLIGCTLYILYRPTSLLMFHWIDRAGFFSQVMGLRVLFEDAEHLIPSWLVYSLPFSIWVLSYQLFIHTIQDDSNPPRDL